MEEILLDSIISICMAGDGAKHNSEFLDILPSHKERLSRQINDKSYQFAESVSRRLSLTEEACVPFPFCIRWPQFN